MIEPIGEQIGQSDDITSGKRILLALLIEHLYECAYADCRQEGDDQDRNGAPQNRFGSQQAMVRWLCYRLRQSLDRIGLDARIRRMRTRHVIVPWGSLLLPSTRRMRRIGRIIAI
jgi:hypothetical protein